MCLHVGILRLVVCNILLLNDLKTNMCIHMIKRRVEKCTQLTRHYWGCLWWILLLWRNCHLTHLIQTFCSTSSNFHNWPTDRFTIHQYVCTPHPANHSQQVSPHNGSVYYTVLYMGTISCKPDNKLFPDHLVDPPNHWKIDKWCGKCCRNSLYISLGVFHAYPGAVLTKLVSPRVLARVFTREHHAWSLIG